MAEDVICKVLEQENCPYDAEVNIVLTGEYEIRETNRNFRNIDSVTDVLSFPAIDFEAPADYIRSSGSVQMNLSTPIRIY